MVLDRQEAPMFALAPRLDQRILHNRNSHPMFRNDDKLSVAFPIASWRDRPFF